MDEICIDVPGKLYSVIRKGQDCFFHDSVPETTDMHDVPGSIFQCQDRGFPNGVIIFIDVSYMPVFEQDHSQSAVKHIDFLILRLDHNLSGFICISPFISDLYSHKVLAESA